MSNKLTLKEFDGMYNDEKGRKKIKAMKQDLKLTEEELKNTVNEYKKRIDILIDDKNHLQKLIKLEEDKITE